MKRLLAECYLHLLWIEFFMVFRNLNALHSKVRREEVRDSIPEMSYGVEEVCNAMDLACVFYPKQVLCLQRSAATTLLLRRHGIRAEMVIGAHLLPFKSHAWVEVAGVIVNDKPYMQEIYQVLERC
jgi:hypothetical protein